MNEIVYKYLCLSSSRLVRYSLLSALLCRCVCVGDLCIWYILRYGSCILNSVFLASALCTEKAYGVIPLCRGGVVRRTYGHDIMGLCLRRT